jgi:hypothetical protein
MRQLFWCVLQGAIVAGLYAFLRGACPDCAPVSASVLALFAAFAVTITFVGLCDLTVAIVRRLRPQQRPRDFGDRLPPGRLALRLRKGRAGTDHLAKLRRLPPV